MARVWGASARFARAGRRQLSQVTRAGRIRELTTGHAFRRQSWPRSASPRSPRLSVCRWGGKSVRRGRMIGPSGWDRGVIRCGGNRASSIAFPTMGPRCDGGRRSAPDTPARPWPMDVFTCPIAFSTKPTASKSRRSPTVGPECRYPARNGSFASTRPMGRCSGSTSTTVLTISPTFLPPVPGPRLRSTAIESTCWARWATSFASTPGAAR